MISVERSFEAWEEVQRHGQDLADMIAQGLNGLIQTPIVTPSFPWPNPSATKLFKVDFPPQNFMNLDLSLAIDNLAINGVADVFDIGHRIGQVGIEFGSCLNGVFQHFFKQIPLPFQRDEKNGLSLSHGMEGNSPVTNIDITHQTDLGSLAESFEDSGFLNNDTPLGEESNEEDTFGVNNAEALEHLGQSQGSINFSSTYDSRTKRIESSLNARGDLWRIEASQGSSTPGNINSSLFLVQLGPVLFVRNSTLLLPVHLSKQHLLWYGYDRKRGMHSLCPAVWSKHRRWLLMSTICLSPLSCSFMDLQFSNGQITYESGEGLSTSVFLPLFGGLLQAQGQYPGEMKFSFSCKNKWGTRITPTLQWPDKSFAVELEQAMAWKRTGLLMRPTMLFSICPTIGGSYPGLKMELTHSMKERLNLICGCALVSHPSAFASVSVGRSKWNGNGGNAGAIMKVETPLYNFGRPTFSIQFNSGIEL